MYVGTYPHANANPHAKHTHCVFTDVSTYRCMNTFCMGTYPCVHFKPPLWAHTQAVSKHPSNQTSTQCQTHTHTHMFYLSMIWYVFNCWFLLLHNIDVDTETWCVSVRWWRRNASPRVSVFRGLLPNPTHAASLSIFETLPTSCVYWTLWWRHIYGWMYFAGTNRLISYSGLETDWLLVNTTVNQSPPARGTTCP